MNNTTSANVVIIGAGVAGGLVAELLLSAGVTGIVVLDAGPPVLMRDQRTWYDVITTGVVPYGNLYDDPGDFNSTGNPTDLWNIVGGRLFGRGGSTLHWGGWCPRFMPEDFAQFTNTGLGADWPYQYADLEPFYAQAEQYLQVGGNAFEGQRDWRSSPYPMTAAPFPITARPIISALDSMGISHQSMPVARNTVSINGQSPCMTNTTCHYCPIGGRFTADQAFDRVEASEVQLITNAPALAITMSSKSQANGVQYLDPTTGEPTYISANMVFVCCGAFESPKLLLASASSYWPNGIGNDNGLVGSFLVANPYIYCSGTLPQNPLALQQELSFPTLCSREYDSEADQPNGKFLMNMSDANPFIDPGTLMYQGTGTQGIQAAVNGPTTYVLQGALSAFGYQENKVGLASNKTRFGLPGTSIDTPTLIVPQAGVDNNYARMTNILTTMGCTNIQTGRYHQRGDHSASTCRMSLSEADGVVDPTLRVWGTENIYVASNAAIPAIGAANITLTLVAAIMKAMGQLPAQYRPATA